MLLPRLFKWAEYILFASLLIVVCVIFSIMAHFYTYINPAEIEAQFMKKGDDNDEDDKKQLQKGMEMVKRNSTGSHSYDGDDDDDERKKTKMWTKRIRCPEYIHIWCLTLMRVRIVISPNYVSGCVSNILNYNHHTTIVAETHKAL